MASIILTPQKRLALERYNIYSQFDNFLNIPDDAVIETPVMFAGINDWRLRHFGAFSYTMGNLQGISFLGRYCSLAAGINADPGEHPIGWLGSSTLFFNQSYEMMGKYPASMRNGRTPIDVGNFSNFKPVTIGNDVWIGEGAFLKGNIVVGDGAVIAGRSVVTKDVPPYCIVGGNPARIIRRRFPQEISDRMQAVKWWEFDYLDFHGMPFDDPMRCLDEIERREAAGDLTRASVTSFTGAELVKLIEDA